MYLFGASGHGKVLLEIAEDNNLKIDGFIDENESVNELFGYEVSHQLPKSDCELIIAIGDNKIRQAIVNDCKSKKFIKLIHPSASVSKRALIKEGTVVMSGVSINSQVEVGKHCIINTNSSIDHNCIIEDFVHVSPNVALAGQVEIGEGSHIGIGASVIPNVKIGKWCTIGAGSVILKDVPDYAVVVGIPGKIIKFNEN